MGIVIHFCSDIGTTWYLVWPFEMIVLIVFKILYDLFQVEYGKFWSGHARIGRTASDGLALAPTSICVFH